MAAEKIGRRFAFPRAGAGFNALARAAVFARFAFNDGGASTRKLYLLDPTPSSDLTQWRPLPRRRRSRHGGVFNGGAVTS